MFLVSLPAGKYRVEVNPPPGAAKEAAPKAEVKEGEVAEVKVAFVVALP